MATSSTAPTPNPIHATRLGISISRMSMADATTSTGTSHRYGTSHSRAPNTASMQRPRIGTAAVMTNQLGESRSEQFGHAPPAFAVSTGSNTC